MKIINSSKKTSLSSNAHPAKSLIENMLGLIAAPKGQSMIFKTKFGIHTFFMKYPLDILILDNNSRVTKLKQSLMPNNIFFWNPKHSTIIELPPGAIIASKTKVGDFIDIIC